MERTIKIIKRSFSSQLMYSLNTHMKQRFNGVWK
jgi:hypothetical protein